MMRILLPCRRRPHSVVLLERVDRAHPEVLALLVQVILSFQHSTIDRGSSTKHLKPSF